MGTTRNIAWLLLGVASLFSFGVLGQELSFYTDYPAVVVSQGREVSLEVKLLYTGYSPVDVELSVAGPEDWNPRFETSGYPIIRIQAVHLLPGEEEPKVIRFKARPPEEAPGGDYQFTLTAATPDGALRQSFTVTVTLEAEAQPEEEETEEVLQLVVDYPSLENAAGEEFVYTIQIKNQTDEDQVVELTGEAPLGWIGYFTPRWQQDTRITSIKVSAHGTENIRFVVVPTPGAEEGEYSIVFRAQAGDYQASLELGATITGTYELRLASEAEITGSGDTWNIKATEGQAREFTLYLGNLGSAPIHDVNFHVNEPQGWTVEFAPETVDSVPPTGGLADLVKVTVTITPPNRAIPGDYQMRIVATGQEDHASAELRVTVGAAMGWGWIGVGVVVFVVAALTGVFVRLGRR
jgi:uncharacterized membrane protein